MVFCEVAHSIALQTSYFDEGAPQLRKFVLVVCLFFNRYRDNINTHWSKRLFYGKRKSAFAANLGKGA